MFLLLTSDYVLYMISKSELLYRVIFNHQHLNPPIQTWEVYIYSFNISYKMHFNLN